MATISGRKLITRCIAIGRLLDVNPQMTFAMAVMEAKDKTNSETTAAESESRTVESKIGAAERKIGAAESKIRVAESEIGAAESKTP